MIHVSYKNIERLNISGSDYDDNIVGNDGNDRLSTGNRGKDTIDGGKGDDLLSVNSGFDEELSLASQFTIGTSARLSIGSRFANQFATGTSATTSNQRFIYDNITGALYFDADGSAGEFTQVKFAQLFGSVTLTENNFVVV
ncbi:MAG: hypothetical protein V7K71_28855 [Nostoc sp.]|uniref:hypothetical protein n=1 Tax=Nostoc sp. TaxID=1180 RepID=UPI002FFA13CF